MKAALAIFVCSFVASAQAPAPDRSAQPDPKKMAQIEELLAIAKTEQLLQQVVSQYETGLRPQIEQAALSAASPEERGKIRVELQAFEEKLFGVMRERLKFERMKPEYVKIYDESFTSDELAGIIAFYKSPAGQALLQKMPVLTSKSVALATKIMSDTMPEIQKMTAEWVESMKKKYPEPAAK